MVSLSYAMYKENAKRATGTKYLMYPSTPPNAGLSVCPKYPDFVYKIDYGYLKDTSSMDGGGIDVWVGSGDKKIDAIMCIVDLMKRDSEIKILIGCTEEEKQMVYQTHNETEYMKGILIRR